MNAVPPLPRRALCGAAALSSLSTLSTLAAPSGLSMLSTLSVWPVPARAAARRWADGFERALQGWGPLADRWGFDNHEFVPGPTPPGRALRVHLHAGGIDPGSMARRGLRRSGTGFKARLLAPAADEATLAYRVRFAPGFDFVRGGKLPGLFGGRGNSGGAIPDGRDGFSLRLMWRERGAGEVYAYLPTSRGHGSSLLRGRIGFEPGRWHRVEQRARLNRPGHADGTVALRLDDGPWHEAGALRLRDDAALGIEGVFFEVFFGGNDDSWAPRADSHVDFADFSLAGGGR